MPGSAHAGNRFSKRTGQPRISAGAGNGCRSQGSKRRISRSIDGDAVYFHQPARTAHRSFQQQVRHVRQRRIHQRTLDHIPVRPVPQIHDGLLQVGKASTAPFHQRTHVFQGAHGLALHIPGMNDVPRRINAGRAGDEVMGAVAVHDAGAAFKSHPVQVRGRR